MTPASAVGPGTSAGPPGPGDPLCGLRRHMHPVSPSSHSGSRASCSLRGPLRTCRGSRPLMPLSAGGRGALGSVLLQGPCPQGWGPWPGSSLGTGAPRSQVLGTPTGGSGRGGVAPGVLEAGRAGELERPSALRQPWCGLGSRRLCWAAPGLLDMGQEVSSRGQAASGLGVSAWLQQSLPGPPWPLAQRGLLGPPHPLFLL